MSKKQPTASQNDAKTTKKTMKPHKTRSCAKAAKAAKAPASAKTAKTPTSAKTAKTPAQAQKRKPVTTPDRPLEEQIKEFGKIMSRMFEDLTQKIDDYREIITAFRDFAEFSCCPELQPMEKVKTIAKVRRTLAQIAARAKQNAPLTDKDAAAVGKSRETLARLAKAFRFVADEKTRALQRDADVAAERLGAVLELVFMTIGMAKGSGLFRLYCNVLVRSLASLKRFEKVFDNPAEPHLAENAKNLLMEIRSLFEAVQGDIAENFAKTPPDAAPRCIIEDNLPSATTKEEKTCR